jgi:zinc protease
MRYLFILIALFSLQTSHANNKINNLADNSNYLFIETKTLPIVDINFTIKNGSTVDGTYPGLTNLMLNTLMSSDVNSKKIVSYFEDVGAKLSYSVGKESLSISIRSLSDIEQILKLVNIINLAISSNEIDQNVFSLEKDKINRNISEVEKRPGSTLNTDISKHLFSGTGFEYQKIGTKKSINRITSTQVIEHKNKIFNIKDIEINIVGNISQSNSKRIIHTITKNMSTESQFNKSEYKLEQSIHHTEFDSTQSHLAVILPAVSRTSPHYHNILVANYIFGGSGFGSWLMEEIREKRGLSYSVSSYLVSSKDGGYLKISLQTKNENIKLAKNIILNQIKRLQLFDVTEDKISSVKQSILRSFEMRTDTNKKLLNLLSAINSLELDLDYFENYKNNLNKVSKKSIEKSLKEAIDFNRISVFTVGKTIEE